MAAATGESGEDVCLDELETKAASPEAVTPIANTRSRVGSSPLDISGMSEMLIPQSTTSRQFPTKFFTKTANAVLDGDFDELLEYRHLMKHPKYKAIWGDSF